MRIFAVLATALIVAGAGCASVMQPGGETGSVQVKNGQGQTDGTATLTQLSNGVRVILDARGLPPGEKGVHVHEVGRCEGPAFTSAGGHFNPDKKQHGLQNPGGPHAGDLPNITIGSDGTGRLETLTDRISLSAGAKSVFDADGSAIVIHAAPDDFKTDPTGNSGARIACGVIVKQ